jgi:hypothetical protein
MSARGNRTGEDQYIWRLAGFSELYRLISGYVSTGKGSQQKPEAMFATCYNRWRILMIDSHIKFHA